MSLVIVTTTLPSREAADALATQLVEERLAACVQVIGPIESTYRWEGALERAKEWYCHCKSPAGKCDALMARIEALHPYQVPEVIAVAIDKSSPAYQNWAEAAIRD